MLPILGGVGFAIVEALVTALGVGSPAVVTGGGNGNLPAAVGVPSGVLSDVGVLPDSVMNETSHLTV